MTDSIPFVDSFQSSDHDMLVGADFAFTIYNYHVIAFRLICVYCMLGTYQIALIIPVLVPNAQFSIVLNFSSYYFYVGLQDSPVKERRSAVQSTVLRTFAS